MWQFLAEIFLGIFEKGIHPNVMIRDKAQKSTIPATHGTVQSEVTLQ